MHVRLCVGASVLHTCLVCSFRVLLISGLVENICVVVCVRYIFFFVRIISVSLFLRAWIVGVVIVFYPYLLSCKVRWCSSGSYGFASSI